MSKKTATVIRWFYLCVTLVTFLGILAIAGFEAYIRWSFNQNFSVLDGNALAALALLLGAQMLGLVWLSRSH